VGGGSQGRLPASTLYGSVRPNWSGTRSRTSSQTHAYGNSAPHTLVAVIWVGQPSEVSELPTATRVAERARGFNERHSGHQSPERDRSRGSATTKRYSGDWIANKQRCQGRSYGGAEESPVGERNEMPGQAKVGPPYIYPGYLVGKRAISFLICCLLFLYR